MNVKKDFAHDIETQSYGFIEDIFDQNLNDIFEISKTLKNLNKFFFWEPEGLVWVAKLWFHAKKFFFSKIIPLKFIS